MSPRKRALWAVGGLLERGCDVLDNHTPDWPWLMGRVRCPNGPLARAAFWCYQRGDLLVPWVDADEAWGDFDCLACTPERCCWTCEP